MRVLTDNELKYYSPSVFTTEAWHNRTNKYQPIPTINVINSLRDNGLVVVKAMQSRTITVEKRAYVKHMIRFRESNAEVTTVGDTIPELVLINSYDGTSAYKLIFGLYRLICTNGLVVSQKEIASVRLIHKGHNNICNDAIYAAKILLFSTAKIARTVMTWQNIQLTQQQQTGYAEQVKTQVYDSSIDIPVERFISARRKADDINADGTRDLWRTYNVAQEKLITGGVIGRTTNNRLMRSRAVNSIDKILDYNQELWALTSEYATQLKR